MRAGVCKVEVRQKRLTSFQLTFVTGWRSFLLRFLREAEAVVVPHNGLPLCL